MREIPLTQGQVALVDDGSYDDLIRNKWCAVFDRRTRTFYAYRGVSIGHGKHKNEYLHWRVVGKPPRGFCVDHINGNPLDNRRENLRVVTVRENQQNQVRHRFGKLVGAHQVSQNRWVTRMMIAGKRRHIGTFQTEQEAHQAYLSTLKTSLEG